MVSATKVYAECRVALSILPPPKISTMNESADTTLFGQTVGFSSMNLSRGSLLSAITIDLCLEESVQPVMFQYLVDRSSVYVYQNMNSRF